MMQPARPEASPSQQLVAGNKGARAARDLMVAVFATAFIAAAAAGIFGYLAEQHKQASLKLWVAVAVSFVAVVAVVVARGWRRESEPLASSLVLTGVWETLVFSVATLSSAAGIIHLAVIQQHFVEYWLYGVFFLLLGLGQLAWAIWVVVAPARWLFVAGIAGNALSIAAWVITRTVGLLVGPSAAEVEPVGFGDVVSTIFEALIIVASLVVLLRGRGQRLNQPRADMWASIATTAILPITILAMYSTV